MTQDTAQRVNKKKQFADVAQVPDVAQVYVCYHLHKFVNHNGSRNAFNSFT